MKKQYNFFCNFCGKKFEVSRWDAKTCRHECRTRNARKRRFVDEKTDKSYCIICRNEYFASPENTNAIICGKGCELVLNEMKIYGMTDEIEEKINTIIAKNKKRRRKMTKDEEEDENLIQEIIRRKRAEKK